MFHLISQDGMTAAGKVPGQQSQKLASQAAFEGGRTAFGDLVAQDAPRAVPSAAGRVANGQPEVSDIEGEGSEKSAPDPMSRDTLVSAEHGENGIDAGILPPILPDTSSRPDNPGSASDPVDGNRHLMGPVGGDAPGLVEIPLAMAATDSGTMPDASSSGLSSGVAPESAAPSSRDRSGANSVLHHRFSTQAVPEPPSRNGNVEATYAGLAGLSRGPQALNLRHGQSSTPGSGVGIGPHTAGGGGVPLGAVSAGDGFGNPARGWPEGSLGGTVPVAESAGRTEVLGRSFVSASALTAADPVSKAEGSGQNTVAAQQRHVTSSTENAPIEPGQLRTVGSSWTGGAAFLTGYAPVPGATSLIGTVLPVAMVTNANVALSGIVNMPNTALSGVSSVMAQAATSGQQRSATGHDKAVSDALLSRSADQEVSTAAAAPPLGGNTTAASSFGTSPAPASLPVAPMPLKTVAEAALHRMSLASAAVDEAELLLVPSEMGGLALEFGRADPSSGIGRAPAAFGSNATMSTAQGAATQIALAAANGDGAHTELVLDPEELGKVRLNMVTDEQSITMFVMAERPETLDLLRRNIDLLAQEFRELGFSNVTFAFGDGGSSENPTDSRSSKASTVPADAETTNREPDHRPPRRGPDGHLDIRL